MSLWPGHLQPSTSERYGEISACSLDPNPLPSCSSAVVFSGKANIFLSEVAWGAGVRDLLGSILLVTFCASVIVTRLIRDGLSVDRQALHVASDTGQSTCNRSYINPQLLSIRNGQVDILDQSIYYEDRVV